MNKTNHLKVILRGRPQLLQHPHTFNAIAAFPNPRVLTTRLLTSRPVDGSGSLASPSASTVVSSASLPANSSSSDPHANHSSELLNSPVSDSNTNSDQAAHVFTEQTSTSSGWISELPWIDPQTHASYEAGHGPTRAGNDDTGLNNKPKGTQASFFNQPFQNKRRNFVFAHGASGFAKNPGKAPILTPEEDRAYCSVQVGEDSYFRRHDALGVADGVGGWSNTTGANPALYSRKLMHYAFLELEKYDNIEEDAFYDYYNVDPVHIMEESYEQSAIDAKKEGLIGSSTACIAILRDDELRIANLGDCGVSIIRRNEFAFRTEEQQHSFNYPYQLGTGSSDTPQDAQVFTVKVESGDIVVMGTDGIFDNLFDEDILEEVVRCIGNSNENKPTASNSPYGTGKPALTSTEGTTATPSILSSKGVGGLLSGLASGAATTIAAIAGKSGVKPDEDGVGDQSQLYKTLKEHSKESVPELSPIAATAIAVAYPTDPKDPTNPTDSAVSTTTHTTPHPRSSTLVAHRKPKIPEPSIICDALTKRAKSVAEDTRHHGSPFQSRAMQEGLYYQGGKRDDMSVLVAIIKDAEDSPDRR
ncbi:hypothetical protein BGZ76_010274 [Entomortierella beljakovae]|nr:hypothetical protein BGZ76_010274 [Entomortierella beljakovae]